MQTLVETLNRVGGMAKEFAWPMLWQSSLLIGLVFLLDWGVRRRVRAAVRYALWWLVLIKLLLPPSLALPTGLGWWLRAPRSAPAQAPAAAVVVSYGAGSMPNLPAPSPAIMMAPPPEPLSLEAGVLLGATSVSLGLLLWMLVRWQQAARALRRTTEAPAWLERLLDQDRRALGLRRPLCLRLLDQAISPAVCGLVRPVILLPKLLVEQLSREQLRAVLLHELVHLRRADVWANCVQALLQVLYWWHPLLWLANARIRRLREEAVDDAVLLALREEAETYAPTLLQVAKLALQRPLATLGLVGILESRSFLRQRIERLLDCRPPRTAGLSLASVLCLLAVGALALPMGQEPGKAPALPLSATSVTEPLFTRVLKVDSSTFLSDLRPQAGLSQSNGSNTTAQVLRAFCQGLGVNLIPPKSIFLNEPAGTLFVRASAQDLDLIEKEIQKRNQSIAAKAQPPAPRSAEASVLITEGKTLYEQGKLNEAEAKFKLAVQEDPQNRESYDYLNQIAKARYAQAHTKVSPETTPVRTNVVSTSTGRKVVHDKLNRLRLEQVRFDGLPLSEVVRWLTEESRKCDPEGMGVRFNMVTNQPAAAAGVDPSTGQLTAAEANRSVDIAAVPITIQPALSEVRLGDALDAIIRGAGTRIKYSLEDEGVFFSIKTGQEPQPLYVRVIKVDPNTFVPALRNSLGLSGPADTKTLQQNLRDFFSSLGIDLTPPKSLFFKDKEGTLWVRAYLQELDTIETAVQVLNIAPPQINLKATFLDLPDGSLPAFWNSVGTSNACTTNGVTILTAAQAQKALQVAEANSQVRLLDGVSVTTLSGRQTEIQSVNMQTIVMSLNPQALKPPGIPREAEGTNGLYLTTIMPLGPTLNVIPRVAADDFTISLTSIATLTEFLGYDQPTNSPTVYIDGKPQRATLPLPQFRVRSLTNSVVLWDGQTMLLGGPIATTVKVLKDKVPVLGDMPLVGKLFQSESRTSKKSQLFVLITSTIITPTGNRVHTDEEIEKVSAKNATQ